MSFGIANNVRSREVRTCTPELFHRAMESRVVAEICAQIKDALEAVRRGEMSPEDFETLKSDLKKALIIFTFHATFKNGRRKNDEAIPSGFSIYDLDHIQNPEGRWAEIEPRKEELGIVLAHVTPSSEGLRLVFIVPQGMDLADAQAWMAKELKDEAYDACVKDYARCSFAVPREYVLFVDEEKLFADDFLRHGLHGFHGPHPSPNEVFDHLDDTERYDKSVLSNQPEATKTESMEKPCNPCNPCQKEFPETFKGTPYATIIAEWFKQNGGEPEPGERNTKLHRLASHLRYITDNNEAHLLQIMPNFGLTEEEMKTLIHHACIAKFYGMPKALKKLLSEVRREHEEEKSEIINHKSEIDTPPPMPSRLPPLIRLLVSKTPKIYRPAVAHAVFPPLASYLWKTYFRYIDNVEHEATLMCCLMAGSGAGKNCISEPINHILKEMRKRDKENLLREKEWKKEMQTKGANKDKRQRPEGLVIQEIDPDMTNAAFVQRLSDAEERFLYAKMNEIDQFDALKTSARSKAQFQIMCLAFDPGNVYGQTRVGTGSVSERVCIRFNWNASTTIRKGQSYFRSVLTDGPVSRINFCTIPEQPIGADMPIYGTYDAQFDEELRPYIERLAKARGVVECPGAKTLAKKLKDENAEFARLSQSRVYENLSFRANVIAYLKAMVLYVAHGEKWDKTMEDFVRWSLQYDMYCKMKFFGNAIESQEYEQERVVTKGPQNLLDLLPEIFTREEAQSLRQRMGIQSDSLRQMLFNWRKRGYIEIYGEEMAQKDIGRQRYIKTEGYLKKHPQREV